MCCCFNCFRCACVLPIRGIFTFLSTRKLWNEVLVPVILMMLASILVLVLMFVFAYKPQKDYLESGRGWEATHATLAAIFLVLLYTSLGTLAMIAAFFGQVQENITAKLLQERQIASALCQDFDMTSAAGCCEAAGDCARGLGRNLAFLVFRLIILILLLPVQAVPVIGTVLYCALNGWIYTWDQIGVFLAPLGYTTFCEQKNFACKNSQTFMLYGGVAFALELLPVVGILFMFSNACGNCFLLEGFYQEYTNAREPLLDA